MKQGKHVLVEGANAAMLDIDFGKKMKKIIFIYYICTIQKYLEFLMS